MLIKHSSVGQSTGARGDLLHALAYIQQCMLMKAKHIGLAGDGRLQCCHHMNVYIYLVAGNAGLSPSTFTSGNNAVATSEGGSSQFGGTVQSTTCTADPTLLSILKAA